MQGVCGSFQGTRLTTRSARTVAGQAPAQDDTVDVSVSALARSSLILFHIALSTSCFHRPRSRLMALLEEVGEPQIQDWITERRGDTAATSPSAGSPVMVTPPLQVFLVHMSILFAPGDRLLCAFRVGHARERLWCLSSGRSDARCGPGTRKPWSVRSWPYLPCARSSRTASFCSWQRTRSGCLQTDSTWSVSAPVSSFLRISGARCTTAFPAWSSWFSSTSRTCTRRARMSPAMRCGTGHVYVSSLGSS